MTIKSRGLLIVFEGLDRSGKRYIYNKIEIF
jgi:thymidylate kinase